MGQHSDPGRADFIGLLHYHFHVRLSPYSLNAVALSPDFTVLVTKQDGSRWDEYKAKRRAAKK